ncbi:hypothetical protein M407DRAFT_8571 [Tulasnella calospora MUT 4182]|uniref:Uncharacterized protein n=1 Tax=Tulasnella calospora MUT 4182 TaxID=1051891 RepID=A0A0C3QHA6_9AGAM|nr:hypothetical protein M407DRAFT_8571 [Tulasnella calospora MUT 4182]
MTKGARDGTFSSAKLGLKDVAFTGRELVPVELVAVEGCRPFCGVVGAGVIIDNVDEGKDIGVAVEGVMLPVGRVLWTLENGFAANELSKMVLSMVGVVDDVVKGSQLGEGDDVVANHPGTNVREPELRSDPDLLGSLGERAQTVRADMLGDV